MEQASSGITDGVVATPAVGMRTATRVDVTFIVDTICAESRRGHFGCDADRADIVRGVWHQIDSVVCTA